MSMVNNECSVCYKPNVTLGCSKCRRVYYCSKEHQLMVWYAHKKICGNTVNVDTMIIQPPLTPEEFCNYSITSVGTIVNSRVDLKVTIHEEPIPAFLIDATTKRTIFLLSALSTEDRSNMLASARSWSHHDIPFDSPVVELILQFQDRYRYLRAFYSVAEISADIAADKLEALEGFIPTLFNLSSIRNTTRDVVITDSLQVHQAAVDVIDQGPLIMGCFARLQSITDAYKTKVGTLSKSWRYYARTIAELEFDVSLILINHASAARTITLDQKAALEMSKYEKYVKCTKEHGGTIRYHQPSKSKDHYTLPSRAMLPGEEIVFTS